MKFFFNELHDFFYHLLDLWVTIEWFGSVEMNFMILVKNLWVPFLNQSNAYILMWIKQHKGNTERKI